MSDETPADWAGPGDYVPPAAPHGIVEDADIVSIPVEETVESEAPAPETKEPMQALLDGESVWVPVPGTNATVHLNKLEYEDNLVRVWVDGSTEAKPSYVIVNQPTEVSTGANTSVEDPLGAIALSIYGVKH